MMHGQRNIKIFKIRACCTTTFGEAGCWFWIVLFSSRDLQDQSYQCWLL